MYPVISFLLSACLLTLYTYSLRPPLGLPPVQIKGSFTFNLSNVKQRGIQFASTRLIPPTSTYVSQSRTPASLTPRGYSLSGNTRVGKSAAGDENAVVYVHSWSHVHAILTKSSPGHGQFELRSDRGILGLVQDGNECDYVLSLIHIQMLKTGSYVFSPLISCIPTHNCQESEFRTNVGSVLVVFHMHISYQCFLPSLTHRARRTESEMRDSEARECEKESERVSQCVSE